MGKAQGWILLLLLGSVFVQIWGNPNARATLTSSYAGVFGVHPINAAKAVNPKIVMYFVGALIVLLLMADAAPELSVGIAALIFVGAALTIGPAGITGA